MSEIKEKVIIGILFMVFSAFLYLGGPLGEVPEENEKTSEIGIVERVIDGDTAEIRIDGELKTVRFLGMDTPELNQYNYPEDYRGIENQSCLALWAEKASNYTEENIGGEEVKLVYDPERGKKGYYNRTLAYIEINGRDFTRELIEEGYARVYTKSDFQRKVDYLESEAEAYSRRKGLWNCS